MRNHEVGYDVTFIIINYNNCNKYPVYRTLLPQIMLLISPALLSILFNRYEHSWLNLFLSNKFYTFGIILKDELSIEFNTSYLKLRRWFR